MYNQQYIYSLVGMEKSVLLRAYIFREYYGNYRVIK